MGEILKTENLCHSYLAHDGSEVLALDNINLTIRSGELDRKSVV